ncbi:MAG: hypothetical protein LUF92_08815 [Clostridiales bacterium]|nr:hypothetical protein [Clostridiales bacterium]
MADIPPYFTVMFQDTEVAKVTLDKKKTIIEKYVPDSYCQPFGGPRQDRLRVYEFLESRCYENERGDLKEILEQASLTSNNPWEWVRITHGVTWEDFFWIRFPGENLKWKDVRVR